MLKPMLDVQPMPAPEPSLPRRARGWTWSAAAIGLAAAGFAVGFVWYASQIKLTEPDIEHPADGIVALTGGPDRIGDAIELLAAGRGKRLLITGVNRSTRADEISRLMPRYQALFNCCVDLDHSAINTIGNAVETRRWAREQGFRSLVIVTSTFHMPRAMAELSHQLPGTTLIPYPVVTEHQRMTPWWKSMTSTKTVVFEYLKYIVAVVRMRLDPVVQTAEADVVLRGRIAR